MNEYNYIGNRTKNYFTAYLQKCIRWKRWNYLNNKENIDCIERPFMKEPLISCSESIDEMLERHRKEEILLREQKGQYPKWNELSDYRLAEVFLMLREDEKHFIYQHVFGNLRRSYLERSKGKKWLWNRF